jgi:uncharacterized protein YbjT (DUF2867 family)
MEPGQPTRERESSLLRLIERVAVTNGATEKIATRDLGAVLDAWATSEGPPVRTTTLDGIEDIPFDELFERVAAEAYQARRGDAPDSPSALG